jgi:hypothetical protein
MRKLLLLLVLGLGLGCTTEWPSFWLVGPSGGFGAPHQFPDPRIGCPIPEIPEEDAEDKE